MKQSTIVIILILVLLMGGGFYWYNSMQTASVTPTGNTTTNNNPNGTDYTPPATTTDTSVGAEVGVTVGATAPMSATITYTSTGFTPSNVTIKKGGTVTWVNQSGSNMWVGSASHPTHTAYDGTTLQQHCGGTAPESFDQCENGSTYSFTFDKVGKWNYHNHSRAAHFGSVTVVE